MAGEGRTADLDRMQTMQVAAETEGGQQAQDQSAMARYGQSQDVRAGGGGQVDAEQQRKRQQFEASTAGPAEEPGQVVERDGPDPMASAQDEVKAGGPEDGGGGYEEQPLPPEVATRAQESFGQSFDHVVLRTGPKADEACKKRGARAFTKGSIITLSSEVSSNLADPAAQETIFHELTHVVQQGQDGENGGAGAAEQEAQNAGAAAAAGQQVNVQQGAAQGTEQNEAGGDTANTTQINIPLPGGTSLQITPPAESEDWEIGVGGGKGLKLWKEPLKEGADKDWKWHFPTPFFGLKVFLGAGISFEFKAGGLALDSAKLAYKAKEDTYSLTGTLKTNFGWELAGYLTAGVSADVWVASAGVGVKAKLALSKETPISATAGFTYSPKTGKFGGEVKLSLAALEIALKASLGLFVYYDAIFVSTYCKDWTLAEKTIGKLTFGGLDIIGGLYSPGGFSGRLDPKPFEMQDVQGNIRNAFPSRS